jgi:hypothetical protein
MSSTKGGPSGGPGSGRCPPAAVEYPCRPPSVRRSPLWVRLSFGSGITLVRRQFASVILLLGLLGCDDSSGPTDPPIPKSVYVSMVSGSHQTAQVGTLLPIDLKVRVTDGKQRGARDIKITWTVLGGGGTIAPDRSVTDVQGYATSSWTLGGKAGRQQVSVSVEDTDPVQFEASAIAGPAAALVLRRGAAQVGKVWTSLQDPLVVRVTDAFGNGVSGERVVWRVFDSLGVVTPDTALSNGEGEAETKWMMASLGEDSVSASVGKLDPVTFRATATMLRFADVSAGQLGTCALDEMGKVRCWGADMWGSLGRGYPTKARGRCQIPSAIGPCEWLPLPVHGEFSYTALGDGPQLTNCAISDGRVLCWGNDLDGVPEVIQGGVEFVDVRLGWGYACGLTSKGTVVCWGSNAAGTLGNPDAAAACPNQACGSLPIPVSGLSGVRRLAVGADHACALVDAGRVYCWGDNSWGRLGVPIRRTDLCLRATYCEPTPVPVATDLRFIDIAAGGMFTCGIATDRKIYCWGANTVQQRGGSSLSQPLASNRSFLRIWAGSGHSCALDEAGLAYCWGWNLHKQLGDGVTTELARTSAAPVAGGIRFNVLSAGEHHTCGISVDGLLYCWGCNGMLQGGHALPMDFPVPVALIGGEP